MIEIPLEFLEEVTDLIYTRIGPCKECGKNKCEDCGQPLDCYEANARWCLPCFDTNHKEEE